MYGITAILIILYHLSKRVGVPILFRFKLFHAIAMYGSFGVEVFLLLSVIGLFRSMSKNSVKQFYINRIKHVAIPFLIMAIPFFAWSNFIASNKGILNFLLDVSTLNFWVNPSSYIIWYVPFTVVLYIIFPLLYKLDQKTRHISNLVIILLVIVVEAILIKNQVSLLDDRLEKALSRIPMCVAGIWLAPVFLSDKKFGVKTIIINILALLVCFYCRVKMPATLIPFGAKYLYGIMAICSIIIYGIFRELICKNLKIFNLFKWLGTLSLEIYVIHIIIIKGILDFYNVYKYLHSAVWYVIIILATIGISYGLSKLYKKIIEKVEIKYFC